MAWTTPRTWVAGELVKEGDLNTHVRDDLVVLKLPITDAGKIVALSGTYLDDLDGTNLTGLAKLAAANSFTAGNQDFGAGATTRVVLPVGADLWAT